MQPLFAISEDAVIFMGCVQIVTTAIVGYLVKRAELGVRSKVEDVSNKVETNTTLTARSANASKVAAGNAVVAAQEAATTRSNSDDKLTAILEMVNELKGSSTNLGNKDIIQ